jgi:two-component system nitrogen regulation response regulator GlnG
MPTLLVIDDEPSILAVFQKTFRSPAFEVVTAQTAADGLEAARSRRPDVIVLDVHLPDQDGLETYRRLRAVDARIPVIFATGKSTTDTAIEAMKLGAYEYLLKPFELSQLRAVIDKAVYISRLMHVPAVLADQGPPDDRADAIIGHTPAMQNVYKSIGRVAGQDVTVLITGESGTGKELVARAIYQHSKRADRPFRTINSAAIPEALLESELFGHEKGAFTGADRRHIGKFEQTNGGTLFLDEVGDMAPWTQTKMLRVLQDQTFERLGGTETIRTDMRLLAATNCDLEKEVVAGRFRKDLYYRLGVFTIHLPPLRERLDDLPRLVGHYLRRFSRELGKEVQEVAPDAMALLRGYSWPGNIRELQSVLKQALLQAAGPVLLPEFFHGSPALLRPAAPAPAEAGPVVAGWEAFIEERLRQGSANLYAEAIERLERLLLPQVLRHTGGNQLRAAGVLGITRGSLRNKLRELGIRIDRTVNADPSEGDRDTES